jgi:DNA polymerase-3 subunit epsilon
VGVMDFVAVDVETANPDLASICQIGIVTFAGGVVVSSWQSLVNPKSYFDDMNVSIHGITHAMVQGEPTFAELSDTVRGLIGGKVVASHMAFDRVAIHRAIEKVGVNQIECTWLDTARVARRAWASCAERGYGLRAVADHLGIQFRHHDAQEDARTAGEVLVRAIRESGLSLDDWLSRVERPIAGGDHRSSRVARDGNPDGPLAGEVIVFTGALSMPRKQAAELAAQAGCDVSDNVNKHVTILVLGDQDIRKLDGYEKSSKHRKAEYFIGKGLSIRIIGEDDFGKLVGS